MLVMTGGCGSTLWLITPRPDTTYYEVTRTTTIDVTTSPRGVIVYVDGAESGLAPRSVAVAYKEVRRQRRQATWPAIIGTAIDIAAFTLLTVAAADEEGPALALPIAGVGLGVALLDTYLITGRSVINEGVDLQPAPVEIGVRAPGFEDAARRVRVPEFTRLHFQMTPAQEPAPAHEEPAPTPTPP